jgi:hypothetical protein
MRKVPERVFSFLTPLGQVCLLAHDNIVRFQNNTAEGAENWFVSAAVVGALRDLCGWIFRATLRPAIL